MDGLTIEAARVLVSKEPYSHLFILSSTLVVVLFSVHFLIVIQVYKGRRVKTSSLLTFHAHIKASIQWKEWLQVLCPTTRQYS